MRVLPLTLIHGMPSHAEGSDAQIRRLAFQRTCGLAVHPDFNPDDSDGLHAPDKKLLTTAAAEQISVVVCPGQVLDAGVVLP